ncbi:sugar transporter [Leisingera daeponensis]|uniref:Sugar transporter n=1 Tax=Leisingera daeponensis TaxID=405746 RepID=A0ABS7NIF6_9RHOB|nr:sugar transporter [Leisingera daeponensis]MBY6140989.1 sugar transporter [Leisingera daeponensis]
MTQDRPAAQRTAAAQFRSGRKGAEGKSSGSGGPSPEDPAAAGPELALKAKPGPVNLKEKVARQKRRIGRLLARAETAEAELEAIKQQQPAFPIARAAHMKRRHWGLIASFALLVLAPLAAAVFYLFAIAEDQYASTAGFTVRSQDSTGANDLLGGLASFTGNSTASDSDILYEFIQSQEMVAAVEARTGLSTHFASRWPGDWVFALWPGASLEDLTWYWQRVVRIAYDSGSGLTEVQVTAFDAQMAQAITRAIVEESQTRINALNEQARTDAMRYAEADLAEALERLKAAREALTRFRTRTRIVDPEADIQARMGVMNNLQQQLAEALIEYDLLAGTVPAGDVRLNKAQQKIEVIRGRIDIERQTFASSNTDTGGVGEDYPTLISEFERLTVDREFAEETYRAALAALELARDEAARQSRYLATYITPTLATEAEYPRRYVLSALTGLFLLLVWAIGALIFYSVRDRS